MSETGWAFKICIAGSIDPDASGMQPVSFPLLQWLAVYLLGTVLGDHVGRLSRRAPDVARRFLLRAGLASNVAGLWLYFSAKDLAQFRVVHAGISTHVHLTSPIQKLPPSAAYLLFFGGFGLMLMWVWCSNKFLTLGLTSLLEKRSPRHAVLVTGHAVHRAAS
jgi:hypothetical protein